MRILGECYDTTLESQLMTAFMRFQRTQKAPLHEKFNRSEVMLIGAIMHLQMESEEPVTVSRLSQKLRVATPTVTKLLSAMEEKGIVERTVSRRDRRKIIVSFTEAGLEMGKKAQEHFM
ncbi:MAG: MarR family winged helix-turn-helix transcriptional regulator [Clostridia bacterium]